MQISTMLLKFLHVGDYVPSATDLVSFRCLGVKAVPRPAAHVWVLGLRMVWGLGARDLVCCPKPLPRAGLTQGLNQLSYCF